VVGNVAFWETHVMRRADETELPTLPWFADETGSNTDPVKIVQHALSETASMNLEAMVSALDQIVAEGLWQQDRPFESFGEFVVALPPTGLGVRSVRPMKILRHALLTAGRFAQWTEALERVARERGRPRKKLANDEDFERFYTVPTASTARDRLLLVLKRDHPEHFSEVCSLRVSPREAGIRAGLITAGSSRYGGACNIAAAAELKVRAQGNLLCELFEAMSADAQCALIARVLEPRLGFGLAQRWRDGDS
jgi:hypothetical protein